MKLVRNLSLLAGFLCFSCSNDDNVVSEITSGTMTATVTGALSLDFVANDPLVGAELEADGTVLAVSGNDGSLGQIIMVVSSYTGSGTYTFGITTGSTAVVSQGIEAINSFSALSGEITVEEAANGVRGTFTINGANTEMDEITISDGEFQAVFDHTN